MRFMAYVFGANPEELLKKYTGSEYDFIVGKELKSLCDANGIPFKTDKLFDTIREVTGVGGTVAFVEPDQVNVICPRLYLAGVRHFVTIVNGVPKAIHRLVLDEKLMTASPVGQMVDEATKDIGESFDFNEFNALADKTDIMLAVTADHTQNTLISGCVVGGHWKNWLIKKEGDQTERFDSLPLKDVDWNQMWKEHLEKLGLDKEWDTIATAVAGQSFETSHAILNRYRVPGYPKNDKSMKEYDKALQEFNNQPPVMALSALGYKTTDINFIARGKEAYQKFKGLGSFLPLAYLTNGKWEQRAHRAFMGLFEEEIFPDEWLEQMTETMNSLSGDTLVTVMECHC